jgi:8-oxo-dGTP diphosphatase
MTVRSGGATPRRKVIHVVGAVIVREGLVLCARRGMGGALGGLWEFPGGKIEPDESARDALLREITEELECEVAIGDEVTTTTHPYDFGDVVLTTFWCELSVGEPNLTEHSEVRWLPPADLDSLDWAPADIPAVRIIQEAGLRATGL